MRSHGLTATIAHRTEPSTIRVHFLEAPLLYLLFYRDFNDLA